MNVAGQPGRPTTASAGAPAPTAAATGTQGDAESSVDTAAGPGQLAVSLKFATDSWVEIYDGSGKAVFYDLGRAGTERSFSASAPLSVTIGNAAGVGLSVNGRPVALPAGEPGETVARFSVAADGELR
jgi:cytoskeleton protein RodZ